MYCELEREDSLITLSKWMSKDPIKRITKRHLVLDLSQGSQCSPDSIVQLMTVWCIILYLLAADVLSLLTRSCQSWDLYICLLPTPDMKSPDSTTLRFRVRAFVLYFLLPMLLPHQSQFSQIGNSLQLLQCISEGRSCALQKMDGWSS